MSIVQGDNSARKVVSPQPAPRSYKTVKGVLALAAAGALLAGGAGTLALWSDSESLNGGSIESGYLRLDTTAGGTWSDTSASDPVPIRDIAAFRVVPGDTLTYSLSTVIAAEGKNLKATLTADPTSVTGPEPLRTDMTVTTLVEIDGAPVTTITPDNDGDTVDVTVTFAFDKDSPNGSQEQQLNLANLKLALDQNPR